MDQRDDGRLYSRVTRRSKAILEAIDHTTFTAVDDLAETVFARNPDDFYLPRYERPISIDRLRVYLRYLEHIGALNFDEDKIRRRCPMYQSDAQWAQALADMARVALARTMNVNPSALRNNLVDTCLALMAEGTPPTVPNVIRSAVPGEIQDFEYARWDIYVICDGPNSVLQIRRFPTIWKEELSD